MTKGQVGIALAVIVIIIIIFALASFLLRIFTGGELNIFSITPLAFPVIILAGVCVFLGYWFASRGNTDKAKWCFNSSVVLTFFGILMIEAAVFGAFLTKVSIPYQPCEKEENPINIASCIMTGYKTSEEYLGWQWASFWIFFIILPFAFIFSLVWGFLRDTRILPKPAMMVISFVLATYATRQVFGTFLLDIAAYGTWGVVGISIPLLLSFMLKRVFDTFLGPAEEAKETLYGMLSVDLYATIENIEKDLRKINEVLPTVTDAGTLQAMKTRVEDILRSIPSIRDVVNNMSISTERKLSLLARLESSENLANSLKKAIEDKIKRVGSPSLYHM